MLVGDFLEAHVFKYRAAGAGCFTEEYILVSAAVIFLCRFNVVENRLTEPREALFAWYV